MLIATPVIWFGVSYINSHSIQLPSLEGFDFKTPALYFFSAVAQTMGALLAISMAILYTLVINLKPPAGSDLVKFPAYEPLKRLATKDPILTASVKKGLWSILTSLIGIAVIFFTRYKLEQLITFVVLCGITGYLAITSISKMLQFIRTRLGYYTNPVATVPVLLGDYTKQIPKRISKQTIKDCIEIMILEPSSFKHEFKNKNGAGDIPYYLNMIYNKCSVLDAEKMVSDIFDTTLKDIRLTVPEHYRQTENIKTILGKLFHDADLYFFYGEFNSNPEILESMTKVLIDLPVTTSIEDEIYKESKKQILTRSMQTGGYDVDFIVLLVYKFLKRIKFDDSGNALHFSGQLARIAIKKDEQTFNKRFLDLEFMTRKSELMKCLLYATLHQIHWYFISEDSYDFKRRFNDDFENNSGKVYRYIWTLYCFEKDQNILQTYLSEMREEIHVFKEEPEKFELASKILSLILDNEAEELEPGEYEHAEKINVIQTKIHLLIRENRTPQM